MFVVPVQPGAELPVTVADSNPPSTMASVPPPPDDVTVSAREVACVFPPPVPVIVTVYVPTGVDALVVIVAVELPDPGAAIELGLNDAVAPVGRPDADSEMAELKEPEIEVEIVEVDEVPWTMLSALGAAAIVKSAAVGLKTILSTG